MVVQSRRDWTPTISIEVGGLEMNMSEMVAILNHENPDEWKKYNETWIQMKSASNRVREVAYDIGKKKLVILYGPHGIAKTTGVKAICGKRLVRYEKAWTATDPDQRLSAMGWCTPWTISDFLGSGHQYSRPAVELHLAKSTRYYSMPRFNHNLVILDDLKFVEQTKDLIHGATDFEAGNEVTWDTSRDIVFDGVVYPNRFIFHGSLIIINNVKKDSLELEKKFSEALRDRGHEIFFSWDRMDIGIYLERLFYPGGGGHRFINRPKPDGTR